MASTFNHPKPVVPAVIRDANKLARTFNRAIRNPSDAGLAEATHALTARSELLSTPAVREQIRRYNREVDAYNNAVLAHRAGIKRARQIRTNAAEVASVRAAACPVCTMTHAGQC